MSKNYASDETVRKLFNLGRRVTSADWIYTKNEAEEHYLPIIGYMDWTINALHKILSINATLNYVVVDSVAPFQVTRVSEGFFILLVDHNAYYDLLGLSLRVQSLPDLSEFLGLSPMQLENDYSGKYLIDIVKDFMSKPINLVEATSVTKSLIAHQSAFLFIVGHEITYITHGHLDFMRSNEYKKFTDSDFEENLTLRTLEMDADSSGTTNVFFIMESRIPMLVDNCGLESDIERSNKLTSLRRQYIAGIYVALLYTDARLKSFFTPKYPTSYARFLTATGVLETVLKKDISYDASQSPEHVRKKLVDSFAKISGGLGGARSPYCIQRGAFWF
ncbi:MAG: hypothetical protein WA154_14590 [Moraxellaceae bacterium]